MKKLGILGQAMEYLTHAIRQVHTTYGTQNCYKLRKVLVDLVNLK